MSKDNRAGTVEDDSLTPSTPATVIFVSNDENHSIELEPAMVTMRNGMPIRIEGSRIQFIDRVLTLPADAKLELKATGKSISIVDFLRKYHRCNIDYREAVDLESVNGKRVPYIDRLSGMSYDQVKAEAVRAGVRVVEGDSKEKVILEILRNKKEG